MADQATTGPITLAFTDPCSFLAPFATSYSSLLFRAMADQATTGPITLSFTDPCSFLAPIATSFQTLKLMWLLVLSTDYYISYSKGAMCDPKKWHSWTSHLSVCMYLLIFFLLRMLCMNPFLLLSLCKELQSAQCIFLLCQDKCFSQLTSAILPSLPYSALAQCKIAKCSLHALSSDCHVCTTM